MVADVFFGHELLIFGFRHWKLPSLRRRKLQLGMGDAQVLCPHGWMVGWAFPLSNWSLGNYRTNVLGHCVALISNDLQLRSTRGNAIFSLNLLD